MFLEAQLKENRDVRDYVAKKLVNSGYILRVANDCYDSKYAMDKELLIKFFEETQPDEIAKFRKIHKVDADITLINTINNQITNPNGKGLIGCLKDGVEVGNNIKFKLMYQIPSTTKNPELNKQYQANTLSVMKEVNCTPKERVDLVIFLNGLAIISFELKCNPAGQSYKNAIAQYRNDRSYNNRLFKFKAGCLVNFALDLEEVYMCSKLEGKDSFFLPFNMGQGEGINAGAGNPTPNDNYPTHYMWDQILQKDNLLELIGKFVFIDKQETINEQTGKRKVKEILVFPRFHQLDAIQKILADVKDNHSDCNYLIQHSAGSGKTYTIAWLAHRLASIHDHDDKVVYDSVLVVTDRVVVDRQLQNAIRSLDHKEGFIKVMDDSCTSADLADAINGRTKIIGTTIQKFRFILDEVKNLKDRKFAIIIDEAHSSTAGKNMLAANIALGEFDEKVVDTDNTSPNQYDEIEKELEKTGKPKNVSVFAFTATPKNKTLELFGKLNVSGQKEAFHRYTMKQAIEEGFILDVLGHYMEYDTYFKINKSIANDPEFKNKKAKQQIARIINLSPDNIEGKTAIIIEHFMNTVIPEMGSLAKAMVVTGSRAEAVAYKKAFDSYIQKNKYNNTLSLVAFSGKVTNLGDGAEYTETGMNKISEDKLPKTFDQDDYKFLLVADKYQTGFDQPKLCAMYVLKKLRGVAAVQTLSRLNRVCSSIPNKKPFVLDFVNTYEEMVAEFAPYYTATVLENQTDSTKIYDVLSKIINWNILDDYAVSKINEVLVGYSTKTSKEKEKAQQTINSTCLQVKKLWIALDDKDRKEYKVLVSGFVRFYEFLMQIVNLNDHELHRWYRALAYLEKYLREENTDPSFDLSKMITVTNFEHKFVKETKKSNIESKPEVKLPSAVSGTSKEDELKHLSQIIEEINERTGSKHNTVAGASSLYAIKDHLLADKELEQKALNNTRKDFELSVNTKSEQYLLDAWNENQELFGAILENKELRKQIFSVFINDIYNKFRNE